MPTEKSNTKALHLPSASIAIKPATSNSTHAVNDANDTVEHDGDELSGNPSVLKQMACRGNPIKLAEIVVARKLATFLAQQNQELPLYSLPSELLVTIIELSLLRDRVERIQNSISRLTELQQKAHVSHRWKTVVEGTPSLWSTIASSDPRWLVVKALERSKGSLLKVCLEQGWLDDKPEDREDGHKFMRELSTHSDRWLEARLALPDETFIEFLPKRPAPNIETLDLSIQSYTYNDVQDISIFSGEAPRLKTLSLYLVPLKWVESAGMLSCLRSLEVRRIPESHFSIHRAVEILRRSPDLEILFLDLPPIETKNPGVIATIPLHHLTTLTLILPDILMTSILGALEAPACSSFNLATEHASQVSVPFEVIQPFITQYRAARSGTDLMFVLELSPGLRAGVAIFPKGTEPSFFHIEGLGVEGAIRDVDEPDITRLLQLHGKMSIFEELTIAGKENPRGWLAYLATPVILSDGSFSWPFPELKVLIIWGADAEGKDVLKMVRRRYGDTGTKKGSASKVDLPARFSKLEVKGLTRDDVKLAPWRAVVTIVGKGVLL